jgi:hypothetical protein
MSEYCFVSRKFLVCGHKLLIDITAAKILWRGRQALEACCQRHTESHKSQKALTAGYHVEITISTTGHYKSSSSQTFTYLFTLARKVLTT